VAPEQARAERADEAFWKRAPQLRALLDRAVR